MTKPAVALMLTSAMGCTFAAQSELLPVAGFNNASADLQLNLLARYSAGETNADGGVMEIITYNTANGFAYAINGQSGTIAIIDINKLQGDKLMALDGQSFDIKAAVKKLDASFDYGDMSSIAVSPKGKSLAAALQAEAHDAEGRVAIFDCLADGSLSLKTVLPAGVQPDMVCFADDDTILTANEGEPREGYATEEADPKGSVTIIKLAAGTSKNIGFEAFDNAEARAALVAQGVILKKGALPSRDLEPEYMTICAGKAYVSLQEANALAVIDIAGEKVEHVFSLGFIDHSKSPIDINNKDKACKLMTHEGVLGMRLPDSVASFQKDGVTYVLTANEGDDRKYGKKKTEAYYNNALKIKLGDGDQSPAGHISAASFGGSSKAKITLLDPSTVDGIASSKDYLFGGRSFSIFSVSAKGLELVFDSGSDFERITAQYLPKYYNCSNDTTDIEDRSGKKGPEPEALTVGQIDGKTYAFIGLERISGVMVYDITKPAQAKFVNYINSRDFETVISTTEDDGDTLVVTGGDVAPEGMVFIPAAQSKAGKPMLLIANEVSGTVSAVTIETK